MSAIIAKIILVLFVSLIGYQVYANFIKKEK
jgi:hypothetical protein